MLESIAWTVFLLCLGALLAVVFVGALIWTEYLKGLDEWKKNKNKKVIQEEKPQPQQNNNNNSYSNLLYESSIDNLKNRMMNERAKSLIMSVMPNYG